MDAVPHRLSRWWGGLSTAERRRVSALTLIASVYLGHYLVFCIGQPFYIEDAGITFAYARNLIDGEGLVSFPGGERVEGYSNALWTFLIAGFYGLGLSPFTSSKLLGAIFGVLTGLLAQPRATWAAFARGRRSANLYPRRDVEPLLDRPLSEVARELHVPPSGAKHAVRLGDAGAFAITSITAIAFGFVAAPFVSGFVALGEMRRATRGGCPFTGAAHA